MAADLFPEYVTWIGVRRGRLLRGYMYEFMRQFAPHLTRSLVDQALKAQDAAGTQAVLGSVAVPDY